MRRGQRSGLVRKPFRRFEIIQLILSMTRGGEIIIRSSSNSTVNTHCLVRDLHPLALLLSVCLAVCCFSTALAVPASPDGVDVVQPDGTQFRMHVRGDEFFSWNETADGYAVVKDPVDRFWKFARPAADRAAFLAIPEARVGSTDPVRYTP